MKTTAVQNFILRELFSDLDDIFKGQRGERLNVWLRVTGVVEIYVRLTRRVIEEDAAEVFDLSNINIEPAYQGQGLFRLIENYCWENSPTKYLYVENVMTANFRRHFSANGWTPSSREHHCFYKLTKKYGLKTYYEKLNQLE